MKANDKSKRGATISSWMKEEGREQKERYKKIVAEMDAIEPERERWIAEFQERIQTRGFSVHAGIRRQIKPEELYPRPKRKLKVVW